MSYIVKSAINPTLIYCKDREFRPDFQVGPGGYAAKIYKQRRNAEKVRNGQGIILEEYGNHEAK